MHTSKVVATLSVISSMYVQPVILRQVAEFEIKEEHGNLAFEVDRLMSGPRDYFQVVDCQLRSQEYHFIEMDYILAYLLLVWGFIDMFDQISTYHSSAKTEVVGLYESFGFINKAQDIWLFLMRKQCFQVPTLFQDHLKSNAFDP